MKRVFFLTAWPDDGGYPYGFVGYDESDDTVRLFCRYDPPNGRAFVSYHDYHRGSRTQRPNDDFVLSG